MSKSKKICSFCWNTFTIHDYISLYRLTFWIDFLARFLRDRFSISIDLCTNSHEIILDLNFAALKEYENLDELKMSNFSNQFIYDQYKTSLVKYAQNIELRNFKLMRAIWRKLIDQLLQKIQHLKKCNSFEECSHSKFSSRSVTKVDSKVSEYSINHCTNSVNKSQIDFVWHDDVLSSHIYFTEKKMTTFRNMTIHWFSIDEHKWYDLSSFVKWWRNENFQFSSWDANENVRDVKRVFALMTKEFDEKIFNDYFAIISSETLLSMMFVDAIIYFAQLRNACISDSRLIQ